MAMSLGASPLYDSLSSACRQNTEQPPGREEPVSEKPIKPVFEEEELKYPIVLIPTMDSQGKRGLAVGFGLVPPEPMFRDPSQMGVTELQMLAIALRGDRVLYTTKPSRKYSSPQANRHGRVLGWSPVKPRQGIAGSPPPAEPPPNLTPKGRKARQKELEKKLAARKTKAKA
jgi:hypothetical protein